MHGPPSWSVVSKSTVLVCCTSTVDRPFLRPTILCLFDLNFPGNVFHLSFTVLHFSGVPFSVLPLFSLAWSLQFMPTKCKASKSRSLYILVYPPIRDEMFVSPGSEANYLQSLHLDQSSSWLLCQTLSKYPLLFVDKLWLGFFCVHFKRQLAVSCSPFLLEPQLSGNSWRRGTCPSIIHARYPYRILSLLSLQYT